MKRKILISDKLFDIAIIGGGITGAGIFREATKRGYRCLLIDKNDFAGGTSSKSAKLVHGGLRYLQNGKIKMVREGLRERNYLLGNFPHLVKPLHFLFPVYSSTLKYHIGMWMYNQLSFNKKLSKYSFLNQEKTIKNFPAINQQNLKGSFLFYDAVTNDARLCNEIISVSQQKGGVAFNYCEFISAEEKEGFLLINTLDKIENKQISFSARFIVNATGHWTDDTLKKLKYENPCFTAPSKGIHLVLSKEKFPAHTAILFPSYANDGRSMYAVPWENNSVVIGTTDTENFSGLDNIEPEQVDIHYILKSIQCFAPSLKISEKDVLSSFAGLRPLLSDNSPSKDRGREYRCWWTSERVITISGGKFTAFHAMAKAALHRLEEKLPSKAKVIPALNQIIETQFNYPASFNIIIEKIKQKYGDQAELIFNIFSENPEHMNVFDNSFGVTIGEFIYFIRYQNCCSLDDILTRRFSFSYVLKNNPDKKSFVERAAELMAKEINWTEEEKTNQISQYFAKHNLN